jgi:bis(5'-nucleosyl)-tetraphosphatase (symmetrical)
MATYAFGDLQGCFTTFQRLLARIGFDPNTDRVWLAGDLVARGPRSLDVLRWASTHRDVVTAVLGNHDLKLLAAAEGLVKRKQVPTLLPILDAPDAAELLDWVRSLPLLHHEGDVLIHAGLLPEWSLADAVEWARRGEAALRGPEGPRRELLSALRPRRARPWAELPSTERLPLAVNVLTALRVVDADGVADFGHRGPPSKIAPGSSAWFDASPVVGPHRVVCGHWAAAGFHRAPGLIALDSGCVWGRCLTAVRLGDGAVFQEPAADR